MSSDQGTPGNGLLLFLRVDDFDLAVQSARSLVTRLEEEPHLNPNTQTKEFSLRDPHGYYVTINALSGRLKGEPSSKLRTNPPRVFNRQPLAFCELRRCTYSQTHESMPRMKSIRLAYALLAVMSAALFISGFPNSNTSANGSMATQGDGSHDFDFLIGDWKAHVRRLPERLKGSNVWVEYNGISNHKKLLDSNANFEEFDVSTPDKKLRIKAQTLRLYNPESHQWSIYLVDLDKGTVDLPPVVGQFSGRRGEFYNQQTWEGRAVLVRYLWLDISPNSSRMEQAFSADGGKTWEVNWICELSR